MDFSKLFPLLKNFSTYSSCSHKGRVVSGFCLGVVVSILVLSLIASINTTTFSLTAITTTANSSSVLSRFYSLPGNSSRGNLYGRETGVKDLHAIESNVTALNSSRGNLYGRETGLKDLHAAGSNATVLKSSRGNLYGRVAGLKDLHAIESNVTALSSNSSDPGKAKDGNFTGIQEINGGFTADKEGIASWNGSATDGTPLELDAKNLTKNMTKDEASEVIFEKKDAFASGSGSVQVKGEASGKCDIFNGRWVRDEGKPYYPAGSCPHIDIDFNCHLNGRPDDDFLRWKWQPYGCDIPSLNATDFLERLRGKRLLFVGDSLNRNMWESLVCILRHSVNHKNKVYEASGKRQFKTRGYYSFRFEDHNCSVDFVRSTFLVKELFIKYANGSEDERLRLDLLDETTTAYKDANVIVFNSGHWWTHEKTSRGMDYYQEGDYVYPRLKVMEAYKKALTTWGRWVDKNVNRNKTQVVFRGYSLTHFRGGQWNSGGQCHKETEPIFNGTYLTKYPGKMRVLEQVLNQMETPVIYLNVSRLTDYRKDGHPSIYRKEYKTPEELLAAETTQDCSHWCLPGIPDTWNELLYVSLLNHDNGSWQR
ncbi:PC-Esterase protein [Dioscorea alata]|uniref:PC-Esterase protein n=1 Tax=Dioscorea alata TaxID=55571 RepID=A0ACB7UF14_DIOAL|nr:PC-Esterase protein [Dioscorea alata]